MAFKTIHTLYGLGRMAAAEASGIPINLVEMAVGDGNGNPTTPGEGQSVLVREMYRATVNRVFQDPGNPRMFTAELVIPASIGGFVIRECGIFDDAGGLFAVANIPDAYKPVDSEGAYADTVLRLQFMVSNADVVTLLVDPNVAVATHTWIINNITPAYLIPGGTTNQLLAKETNADGDFKWIDLDGVNVTVDCIEDPQTLAAGQTIVNLVTTTTRGLAVYIEGVRLRGDQWTADPILNTRLTLAESYPAGTSFVAAQNDPHGVSPDPLLKAQNLADVPDKVLGRSNLGVDSKLNTDTHAPPSEVAYFWRSTAPSGWLKANGAAVSRTAYAALFAVIGTSAGAGDGFNTFNLPDLRGEFIRGWDDGRGVDSGRGNMTGQERTLIRAQTVDAYGTDGGTDNIAVGIAYANEEGRGLPVPADAHTSSNVPFTGILTDNEMRANQVQTIPASVNTWFGVRPRNIALLACIKY